MKILYGVVGEGMGHAIRSRVVIEHLISCGHEVQIIASGRAVSYLSARFPKVHPIAGLQIVTVANKMRKARTLWVNVLNELRNMPRNLKEYFDLIESFEPSLVISDFESWTYYFAKARRLPVFSIDNNQVIHRCKHPGDVIRGQGLEFVTAKTFVQGKLPFCDHYFIPTFFKTSTQKPNTTLVPPVLRAEILNAVPVKGEHLLVYQTAEGHEELADALKKTGWECRIYGMRGGLREEQVDGRLRYRPFDERDFIWDLASARAVVSGGGFTLLSEALYLKKPILSFPIHGYFEQILNARYIDRLGYGRAAFVPDARTIEEFVASIPKYESKLGSYVQNGNQTLLGALDAHILSLQRP